MFRKSWVTFAQRLVTVNASSASPIHTEKDGERNIEQSTSINREKDLGIMKTAVYDGMAHDLMGNKLIRTIKNKKSKQFTDYQKFVKRFLSDSAIACKRLNFYYHH